MTDAPKIMHSWDYAEIVNSFGDKLRPLQESFEQAIEKKSIPELNQYTDEANAVIKEYNDTAEDLAQYGSGKKKGQFLETHEDDIEFIQEQIDRAKKILEEQ